MIEPNNSLEYIMNYYSIQKINNYDSNIKYINSKNDLIYLKMYEDNIYFSHNFNEILNIGDIPEHVRCIYFYHYYSEEIKINVLPSSLEVLFLGNYRYILDFDIIPKNVWFLSINNFNITDLKNHTSFNVDHFLINDNVSYNILLIFICNKISKNLSCNKILTINEYNDILYYFNLKKNIY